MKFLLAILFLAGFGGQVPTTAQISTIANNFCKNYNGLGRNSVDCTKWFRCVNGKPGPMKDCGRGRVFSLQFNGCVHKGSLYDDCIYADKIQNHNNNKFHGNCGRFSSRRLVFPKSDNCAQFYDCSLTPRAPEPGYLGDYIDECPYPKLFSEISNRCEDFESVDCGRRKIIKYACDYEKLKCHVGRCRPCAVNYPDCRGLPDGYNSWDIKLNSPYFAKCYKERGFPKRCPPNHIFSSIFKKCVRNRHF